MASDVDRIAEVIAAHFYGNSFPCDDGRWRVQCGCGAVVPDGRLAVGRDHAKHVAEQLTAAGMGHVPTALHQAADALERQPKTEEWLYAADVIRARADRAGGAA